MNATIFTKILNLSDFLLLIDKLIWFLQYEEYDFLIPIIESKNGYIVLEFLDFYLYNLDLLVIKMINKNIGVPTKMISTKIISNKIFLNKKNKFFRKKALPKISFSNYC